MEEETFSYFLKYGCNLGLIMGSHLNSPRSPYWVKCLERINFMLCKKISQDYDVKKTSESKRFPNLRTRFVELYQCYREELSIPFIRIIEGEKVKNDDWLKFAGEADFEEYNDYNDYDDEDEPNDGDYKTKINDKSGALIVGDKRNRGICVTLLAKDETTQIDAEFPISEMFHTAVFIAGNGYRTVNYPICVLYFIYGCFYTSVPNCDPIIYEELEKFRKYSKLEGTSFLDKFEEHKNKIAPFLEKNEYLFSNLSDSLGQEIDNITDQDIESVSEFAKNAIDNMNGDFMSMMKNFLPGSDDGSAEDIDIPGFSLNGHSSLKEMVDFLQATDNPEKQMTIDELIAKME